MNLHKYDIIGDIHGQANELVSLLEKLGYTNTSGCYRHDVRKAIFLGDFIDRGLRQREVIDIVRPMIESGTALAVMGNHEFNAIAYYLGYRERSKKNRDQHEAFIDAYSSNEQEYKDIIDWFKTLPLWLDLGEIRIVHACWDSKFIARLANEYRGNQLTDQLLANASNADRWEFEAVETLLKGKEIRLPDGQHFKDEDKNTRHHIRVRWWDDTANTYQKAFIGPESVRTHIPDDEIGGDHLIEYAHDDVPVFIGHYWMKGDPLPLAQNIACLDYSVVKEGGKLVAYRWNGEEVLIQDNFVSVLREL